MRAPLVHLACLLQYGGVGARAFCQLRNDSDINMLQISWTAQTALVVLALCTLASSTVAAQQLKTFDAIAGALQNGYKLKFWINYYVCDFDGDKPPGVNAWGGGSLDTFTIQGKHIQSNQGKLIYNYQSASGGYVYDLVSVNIFDNSSVVLNAGDFSAPDPNKVTMYTEQVICNLNEGVKIFVESAPEIQLKGYQDMMALIGNGGSVRTVFNVSDMVVGLPIVTFEAFHEADIGPNRTGFSSSYFQHDNGHVDQTIIACHVYEAGYSLLETTVLDGTTLKPKKKKSYNTTAMLFGM